MFQKQREIQSFTCMIRSAIEGQNVKTALAVILNCNDSPCGNIRGSLSASGKQGFIRVRTSTTSVMFGLLLTLLAQHLSINFQRSSGIWLIFWGRRPRYLAHWICWRKRIVLYYPVMNYLFAPFRQLLTKRPFKSKHKSNVIMARPVGRCRSCREKEAVEWKSPTWWWRSWTRHTFRCSCCLHQRKKLN